MEKQTIVNEHHEDRNQVDRDLIDRTQLDYNQAERNQVDHTKVDRTEVSLKVRRVVYYILGALEVLFAFRLIFKVLGANPGSPFVSIIYAITNVFLAPFNGIFRTAVTDGIETQSVLEPSLIIAMIVYAALAWGIVRLFDIIINRNESETL